MAETIEISAQVKEIINRSNVQLRSLAGLPDEFLAPFLRRDKELLLVFKGKPVKGFFSNRIDDEIFEVEAPEIIPYLKGGAVVIAVMPGVGSRYVIQTSVSALFAEKVRLACLDPRFSQRIVPSSELVVSWRKVPDEVELALKEGGIGLFRSSDGNVIEKVAADGAKGNPPGFEGKREFAVIGDISTGGCSLISKAKIPPELANHLLYIENEDSAPCRMGIFGVARSVRAARTGSRANIMFVGRIAEEIARKVAGA